MLNKAFLEFLNQIEIARKELKCSTSGAFYRGHPFSSYSLNPSLLREENNSFQAEHNLYVDCYARGRRFAKDVNNSWELLSMMQHYGIPTRLLDWSESLAVALFFALAKERKGPHIWVVNAFRLNNSRSGLRTGKIVTIGIDKFLDYQHCFIDLEKRETWPYEFPVFLQIPWITSRIRNQKGYFTFHGSELKMEERCGKYIRKVELTEEAIPSALRFLKYSGVTVEDIYPELDGFGRYLKGKHLFEDGN